MSTVSTILLLVLAGALAAYLVCTLVFPEKF